MAEEKTTIDEVDHFLYIPAVRKIQCLATMEVKIESIRNISLFWKHFSEVLSSVKGENFISLIPKTSCNRNDAKLAGIEEDFGVEGMIMIVTCQWHFQDGLLRCICHPSRGKNV